MSILSDNVSTLTHTVERQRGMIDYLSSCVRINKDRQVRLESYSMRENVIISGIAEEKGESASELYDAITNLFSEDMSADMSNVNIVRCHRLGKHTPGQGHRKVIVRFSSHLGKLAILKAARNLKDRDDPVFINEQFPREIDNQRSTLRPIMKLGKSLGKRCSLVQEKLFIGNQPYTVDTLDDIPFDVSSLGTHSTEGYVLFNGRISPFSNFFTKKGLFGIEGTEYSSSEQYYQYQRALESKDYSAAAEIMSTTDPVTIKHAGNKVNISNGWSNKAVNVMETGVRAKFSQNLDLWSTLEATGERSFQECNRYDTFWGTGLSLHDAIARDDHSKFQGTNKMGEILQRIRDNTDT